MRISTAEDLRRVMRADFTMSEQQWHAISSSLEPGVVIAGAGSGKTELMAARVVYLVANGFVRADQVLGLTFTTKAAGELAERVRAALTRAGLDVSDEDGERLEPTIATYHSYASLLLREHGLRIGHEPDLRVLADAGRYQLAARAVARHTGLVRELSDHPPTTIQAMLALESQLSEHLVDPEAVRAFHAQARPRFVEALAAASKKGDQELIGTALKKMDERDELLALVAGYRRLKAQYDLVDFSDQIALTCRLAEEHPRVGHDERTKYRVVLLDEYQDTSVAQARLLAGLFSGPTPEEGRGHAVTAVGDPNQAIYGWRGASVSNILRFDEFFPAADGGAVARYPLTVNRRSDVRILDVATALARPLYDHPASKAAMVRPLEPKPGALPGEVRTLVHPTHGDELEWLVGQVREAHQRYGSWKEIGVLVRTNAHSAEVYDALNVAEIPVEIVGLGGLLRLPEVAGVVATLALLEDLTANDALLTLLTGPRWAIGPRDLALLGQRAREIAATSGRADEDVELAEALRGAVGGSDPTEVASLMDALDDPGERDFSEAARHRFELLAAELRRLRAHAGEPLLDLVRRIIDTTGVDVELASSLSPAAPARRENLELFVKAVADFQAIDGQVTLPALLAWLKAEDEFEQGLDAATPSEADSVKLLTIHRAKGLEYDAVFLLGTLEGRFPATRLRSQWTRSAAELPIPLRGDCADLPALPAYDADGLRTLEQRARDHQAVEEARLGYVAFTRARHLLWVSSSVWGPTQAKPFAPSPYQLLTRDQMASWGAKPDGWYVPADGETNPALGRSVDVAWPVVAPTAEIERRVQAAGLVRGADGDPGEALDAAAAAVVARWDDEIARLLEEAERSAASVVDVPLPSALSATSVARLREDPDAFARELARPMPRKPSAAARFGTRFHAWVEARFGQQVLLDPDDLPGRGDAGIDDDTDLQEVIAAFEAGPFATRRPHAVEAPFALVLGGQVVRGRIDAVYLEPGEHLGDPDRYLVVDWKTHRAPTADPLQLALYRVAWAELAGVPVADVTAAFHYVRTGETVLPTDLPGRAELEDLFAP